MHRRGFLRSLARAGLAAGAALAGPRLAAGAAGRALPFDQDWPGDVWLEPALQPVMRATLARLGRVRAIVGHGNFCLIDFDGMLRTARRYASVGAVTRAESDFLEELFETDASGYGFMGARVATRITDPVPRRLVRPAGTYQRLADGAAQARFQAMRALVGDQLVLTSGVRGVVKQAHLFLLRVVRTEGNLSRASRSLAPPGYSYHAVGDFDVGERGLGAANFSERFARSVLYRRLVDAGHLVERYPRGNQLGVRHEPWHVMVVGRPG
jgi:hypothetical protein